MVHIFQLFLFKLEKLKLLSGKASGSITMLKFMVRYYLQPLQVSGKLGLRIPEPFRVNMELHAVSTNSVELMWSVLDKYICAEN